MTDLKELETEETATSSNKWLWLAALAIIAVPVLIGLVLMNSGDDTTGLTLGGGDQSQGVGDSGMSGDSGMGGGSSDVAATAGGVRDFAEIQANEITFDFDPSLGAAVLNVDTNVDVACSVTYGPTQAFGFLATDTDMAGGAHSVHHPRMIGVGSGTVWYRLQGTSVDGTLYQSEMMQFTFPEGSGSGPTVQPPLPNAASQARVGGFSSEYSDAYAASNAIDGDLATEWSTAGDGDEAYIILEFGDLMEIEGVGFRTREMSDGTSITTSFSVTVDGREYGPFDAGPGLAIGLFQTSGNTVRIDVLSSTGGNTGAVEIEVYAEPGM